ncbi:MAG: hypothetical protein E7J94_15440, partial [Clostridium sp.]|nr:hypothetical protein [Clostridium sp.]
FFMLSFLPMEFYYIQSAFPGARYQINKNRVSLAKLAPAAVAPRHLHLTPQCATRLEGFFIL